MLRNLLRPDNRHALTMGIVLVIVGYFLFALNDVVAKMLVASFGVAQVLTIRAIGAFMVLVPLVRQQRETPFHNVHRPILQTVRALLITLDTSLFYAAVIYLPLADVMTFYMAGPIYMTVASHFLLGERRLRRSRHRARSLCFGILRPGLVRTDRWSCLCADPGAQPVFGANRRRDARYLPGARHIRARRDCLHFRLAILHPRRGCLDAASRCDRRLRPPRRHAFAEACARLHPRAVPVHVALVG
ncbi:MAG: hypothetical protein DI607_15480, partial [Sphingomonas hengshuiensis]